MPARIFISVDLPAPFSPIKAWTWPAISSNRTPASARTPGNDLLMSLASTRSMIQLEDGGERQARFAPAPAEVERLLCRRGVPIAPIAKPGAAVLRPGRPPVGAVAAIWI